MYNTSGQNRGCRAHWSIVLQKELICNNSHNFFFPLKTNVTKYNSILMICPQSTSSEGIIGLHYSVSNLFRTFFLNASRYFKDCFYVNVVWLWSFCFVTLQWFLIKILALDWMNFVKITHFHLYRFFFFNRHVFSLLWNMIDFHIWILLYVYFFFHLFQLYCCFHRNVFAKSLQILKYIFVYECIMKNYKSSWIWSSLNDFSLNNWPLSE